MRTTDDVAQRFGKFAAAGIFFQGGAAAIDTGTIVATLVHGLTGGSAVAVGAAATIARAGWLVPQLIVGYVAQRRTRRMPSAFCLDPAGDFLFAAGTASDRLASYRINQQSGALTPLALEEVGHRPAAVLATRVG
jgi:hypothetical protein